MRLVVGTANASCGIPASGQFSKWADCVDLVREHERSEQVRYDVLLKTRPDVLWPGPLLTGMCPPMWKARPLPRPACPSKPADWPHVMYSEYYSVAPWPVSWLRLEATLGLP